MTPSSVRATTVAVVALMLLVAPARAQVTPAQQCRQAKNNEAGKYASCRQKAEAKFALTGDAAARTAALGKCADKITIKWAAIEQKAVTLGGACLTTGDLAPILGVSDAHTDNIASALGGGPFVDWPACVVTPKAQRLETGQTTCWNTAGTVVPCAGTGQDAETQPGLPRAYVDNGDGTITDSGTGLTWEKLSDDGTIHDKDTFQTWANAFAKIATLNGASFAGHTDWRVPTVSELQSLVDYQHANPAVSPAFDTGCAPACTVLTCSCTAPNYYWSSTSSVGSTAFAWIVGFDQGAMGAGGKTGSNFVRAVRGGS